MGKKISIILISILAIIATFLVVFFINENNSTSSPFNSVSESITDISPSSTSEYVSNSNQSNNSSTNSEITSSVNNKINLFEIISFENETVSYDGLYHSIYVSGEIPNDVIINYVNNNQKNEGEYTVIATFEYEKNKYYFTDSLSATLTIVKDGKYHDVTFCYAPMEIEDKIITVSDGTNIKPYLPKISESMYEWDVKEEIIKKDTTIYLKEIESLFVYDYDNVTMSCTLTSYTGLDENIIIPSYRINNGQKYKVEHVSSYVFSYNYNLKYVTLPSTLTSISKGLFKGCNNLVEVQIDSQSQISSIGGEAFKDCVKLKSIYIPSKVSRIDSSAFIYCTSLETIEFSNSCKISEITGATFTGCSSLEKIVLPNEVTTIGSSAFKDCINLKTILVPSKCKTIKLHAFYNCSSLKTLLSYTLENKSEMINKESYDLIVDLSNFTEIGESCFSKCKSIVEVIYSNKKPTIEFSTFYENTSLRKIYIPSNITTIERIAFMFVKDIDIYYDGTLQQWLSIKTNITAPDVLFEGFNLYLNNELLKSITINDSIVKDEYINLSGCKSINEIILGENVREIESNALHSFYGLESITIPKNVFAVKDYAFYNCTNLSKVVCLDANTSLGYGVFSNCNNISSMSLYNIEKLSDLFAVSSNENLPESFKELGFAGTTLKENAIKGFKGLEKIIFTDKLDSIEARAFDGCNSLLYVILPNSIKTIGEEAFINCHKDLKICLPFDKVPETFDINWNKGNYEVVLNY